MDYAAFRAFVASLGGLSTPVLAAAGGLGVERFVEIGVKSAPTVAGLATNTLKLPEYSHNTTEVLNTERDVTITYAIPADATPTTLAGPRPADARCPSTAPTVGVTSQSSVHQLRMPSPVETASTIFWIDPAEELVVVFMTQLMPSGTFNFRGQLKNIIYSAMVELARSGLGK